jgi:hypothetical protein
MPKQKRGQAKPIIDLFDLQPVYRAGFLDTKVKSIIVLKRNLVQMKRPVSCGRSPNDPDDGPSPSTLRVYYGYPQQRISTSMPPQEKP